MWIKRTACAVLACVLLLGVAVLPAGAAQKEQPAADAAMLHAAVQFAVRVPERTRLVASSSFFLAEGDTITVKAFYVPSGDVDIGLVAPDGKFYCVCITNGSLDQTIQVEENGYYTFQIVNHAAYEISVSGYVIY